MQLALLGSILLAVAPSSQVGDDPHRGFDFWLGEWSVNNRHLQGDGSWKDGGTSRARITPVLGGRAVFEEWDGRTQNGPTFGMSLRAYDPEREDWALLLNWPGPSNASFGVLRGTFRHGRGEFFAGAAPNLTRYTFSDALEDSVRWDSSRTGDGGQTWRTDWIMEFSRTAPAATGHVALFEVPWMSERVARPEQARKLDFLEGTWVGEQEGVGPATLRVAGFLKGWAVVESLEVRPPGEPVRERLSVRGWVPGKQRFEAWSLTRADTRFETAGGQVEFAEGTFEGRGPRGTFTERLILEDDGLVRIEEERTAPGGTTTRSLTRLRLVE